MIHTRLCDLLEIEHPIIQAGAGPAMSAQLAAAVSNAGALGGIANFLRESEDVQRQIDLVKELTNRPFALNNVVTTLDEATFQRCLEARPKLMAFALADPHDYVQRVHDAGILVMHQVTTVEEAERAAALMLGAVGVNMGTWFLASDESPITAGHKQAMTSAASQDAVHFAAFNDMFPQWVAGGYNVVLRAIRTSFID